MAETTTRTSPGDFFGEVVEQVKKVTWPDQAQLRSSTGIIVAFMLVMGAAIFLLDLVVRNALGLIQSLFLS